MLMRLLAFFNGEKSMKLCFPYLDLLNIKQILGIVSSQIEIERILKIGILTNLRRCHL
jgi:hypothetical protein